jgi:hypothetical protein
LPNGAGGAIAIYLKRPDDYLKGSSNSQQASFQLLEGYSAIREFYSPDYAAASTLMADTRRTLYWNPYVITRSASGKAQVEFYNNDISKKLRVVVEGIDSEGRLTRTEKIIE